MADMPDLDLIPTSEAIRRLGISQSTLSRWVDAGKIHPALKLEGLRGPFLFDPVEVDRVRMETVS